MNYGKEIYIVTSRWGTCMGNPEVYYTKKDAETRAKQIVLGAVRDDYDGTSVNPSERVLKNWANKNGDFSDYYWCNNDFATEAEVTKAVINI